MSRLLPILALLLIGGCKKSNDDGQDTGTPGVTNTTQQEGSPKRSCEVVIRRESAAAALSVAGRFNNWEPQAMTLVDGIWEAQLGTLVPGIYAHKFVEDEVWETLPPDIYTAWDGDAENRALTVADCNLPGLVALSGNASADGSLSVTAQFTRAADGAGLDVEAIVASVGGQDVQADYDPDTGEISLSVTGLEPGKHSVRIGVRDLQNRAPQGGDVFLPLWVESVPFNWADGLMYFVFTDRFRDGGDDGFGPNAGTIDGTDWMGGDLVGAKAALDEGYFDELGVRSIWLSPVYDNPEGAFGGSFGYQFTGYHGYWPIAGRAVEDRWGANGLSGDQALREFVDAAHEHGIRILLDSVLNHVHEEHEYLTTHPEWFGAAPCSCTSDPGPCNWDSNPIGCWFTDYLPDLNYRQPDLVEQALEDAEWWVETYDIDGFRVDAAKHMDHVILRSLRLRMAERYETPGGPEFYLVGETFVGAGGQWTINEYIAPYELSGQFDFPLLYPIRGIGTGAGFRPLADQVRTSDEVYGDAVHRMSVFLGNHDVGRYTTDMTGCEGYDPLNTLFGYCPDVLMNGSETSMTGEEWDLVNAMAVSFAFVTTQPGPPLLYYGDELGLAGAGDPDNRRMMPWGTRSMAQQTLFDRVTGLAQARRQTRALQTGDRTELWVDDSLYVFSRIDGVDSAIVALHIGGSTRNQAIPIPSALGLEGVAFTDTLAGNRSATVSGNTLNLTLNPWEYVILTP